MHLPTQKAILKAFIAANFCGSADQFLTYLAKFTAQIHGAGVKGKAAFVGSNQVSFSALPVQGLSDFAQAPRVLRKILCREIADAHPV